MQHSMLKVASIVTALLLFTNTSFAQSLFDFNSKNTSAPAQATQAPLPTVLSPNDFKTAVSKMSQETNSNINQQATQQFVKQPPTTQPSTVAPTPPPPTETPTTVNPTQPLPSNTPYSSQQTTPSSIATSPVIAAPISGQTNSTPSSYSSSPLPAKNQPYTGFGTGNSNNNTPSKSSSGNSGGWNIKY